MGAGLSLLPPKKVVQNFGKVASKDRDQLFFFSIYAVGTVSGVVG